MIIEAINYVNGLECTFKFRSNVLSGNCISRNIQNIKYIFEVDFF